MNKKLVVSLPCLLLIYLFLLTPLAYTHIVTPYINIVLLAWVVSSFIIGSALLSDVKGCAQLSSVTFSNFAVFTGGVIGSLLIFITQQPVILILTMTVSAIIIVFFYRKQSKWAVQPNLTDIVIFLAGLLVTVLISTGGDLSKQFTAFQEGNSCYSSDRYYFTSIVASVRHGSLFNAAYETGSPINYQMLGFFIPSILADILGISSHQALWGLAQPFYKLTAILLGYELCFFFLKDKIKRNNYIFVFLAVLLPILLAPLNPSYLVRGVVKNFIFNGIGYLVPSGTVTYPVCIMMLFFCMLLFAGIDWKDRRITADKVFFTLGISLMIIGKVPLYVAFFIFTGAIILKRIVLDKEHIMNYLVYIVVSVALSFALLVYFETQDMGGKNYFQYGFLANLFAGWYGRSSVGIINNIIIIGVIVFTYLLWAGIRMIGLASLQKSKVPALNEYFIGAVWSLLGTTILASFLHMEAVDSKGTLVMDGTFDVDQFIRSSFYIITVVGTIGVLFLIYSGAFKKNTQKIGTLVVAIWCCISLSTVLYNLKNKQKNCKPITWYYDNYNELKSGKYNDGLITVNPALTYGIMLAGSDYGKYWAAMDRLTGDNCSIKNDYRWAIFRNLLDSPDQKYLVQMKNEGVKYIIATPVDSSRFTLIENKFPSIIHKIKETRWIYTLN